MTIGYRSTLFNSNSANSSTYTSAPLLTDTWFQLGVQIPSVASATGSRFSFWVSDAPGDASSIAEGEWTFYSQTTSVSQLTTGHRWLRVTRSAVDSMGTVFVAGASNA